MNMIKRNLEKLLVSRLNKGKALVVLGARQTGKTTLIKEILHGKADDTLMLNCDEPHVRERLTSVSSASLKQMIGKKKFLFIDEAQRVKNIGLTLKLITDTVDHTQLIVSGSSSLDIADEVNEPLTGRKYEYTLYPISLLELLQHRDLIAVQGELDRRIVYGMYPDVIMHAGEEEEILRNLSGSYLYKDILSFRDVRKPAVLEKLLQALAFQVGSQVSLNELSSLVGIDKGTVETYIQLLEKAFIIFRLPPLNRNLRTEIASSRKIYFWDTGIRNAIISNFNPMNLRNDAGALWENFILVERLKYRRYQGKAFNIFVWRTYQQQELDYIEEQGGKLHAFEFKWNPTTRFRFPKTFTDAYPSSTMEVITRENLWSFIGWENV